MRLRDDMSTSRTIMGITWLALLSVGFLCHCATSKETLNATDLSPGTAEQSDQPISTNMSTTAVTVTTATTGRTTAAKPQTAAPPQTTITPTSTVTPTTARQTTNSVNQPATSGMGPPSVNNPTSQAQATSTSPIHHVIPPAPSAVANTETHPTTAIGAADTQQEATTNADPNPASSTRGKSEEQNVPTVTRNSQTTQSPTTTEPIIIPTTTTSTVEVKNTSNTPTTSMTKSTPEPTRAPEPIATGTINTITTAASSTVQPVQLTITTTPASTFTFTSPSTTSREATTTSITKESLLNTFHYSLNSKPKKEEDKAFVDLCKRLMANLQEGNCDLKWKHNDGRVQLETVGISGNVDETLANQSYEELTMKKPEKGSGSKTLIVILVSCGVLIMIIMAVILALCTSHCRKPYNETQQHLTEELHTVENGYHDNPTLEVMEVQPEMQEKKVALNGEFNDSWIVPIDNLLKEDMPDEEDTHL